MIARLRPPRAIRQGSRLLAAFLVAGIIFVAIYFLALTTEQQDFAYQVPGLAAPIAIAVGILRYRPPDPRPWIVLAAGLALTTIGDWTWVILAEMGLELFPSIADGFYLAGLALIAFAVLGLTRGRIPGGDGAGIIDALIVAVGAGLLSWTFLMAPLVADPVASLPELATALAYPLLDLLLLGVLVRLFLVPGRRVASLNLLLFALVALLVADVPYAFLAVSGGYETGHIVELGWLAASILWGAAALHPSMRQVAEPAEVTEARLPAWRLALLASASLMAPGVLVIEGLTGQEVDIPVVAGGSVLLFLLVIARLGGVVRDLRATLHERRKLESELERRALHDPLTGLANRVLFHDRLEHALTRRGEQVAVLFLDLDDFKSVNDTFGHHAGDTLLTAVADAIGSSVRASDTVARLGGDEFAVLVDQGAGIDTASELASRLLAAIARPITVAGKERSTSGSVGIAVGASGVTTAETLMREADIAMYVAKSEGKGRHCVFDPRKHEVVVRTMGLQADLDAGMRDEQFELYYQPVMNLASGEVAGVEALLRWHHPVRGLLMAEDFVRVAESSGAMIPLGRWVLEQAGRQAGAWRSAGPTSGNRFLSVNLSASELVEPGIVELVAGLLRRSRLAPHQLLLEITESVQPDTDAVARTLNALKELGVRLAIDDFGTGFGSMNRLLRHPFDVIKIDGSLVSAMRSDPRAASLVTGVVDLARRLGSTTIAEGVEAAEEISELRAVGCELAQGFHFAPALPASELEALLQVSGSGPLAMRRRPVTDPAT